MTYANPSPMGLRSPLLAPLARNWDILFFRGLLAILFGAAAVAWPTLALATLVWLFGIFAFADGVFSLIAGIRGGDSRMPRWWLIVVGLAGIAAGILAVSWTGMTALLLITFIGVWAIVHGVFEVAGAIALRREIDNEWMLILHGALSVLFGLYIVIFPGAGALAVVWVIGIYAILAGIMMLGLALRLRRHAQQA